MNHRFPILAAVGLSIVAFTAFQPSANAATDGVWSVPTDPVEAASPSHTSGLSLAVGFGYQTPLWGAQASYDLRLGDSGFTLAPWAGIGSWTAPALAGPSTGWHAAYAGGVMAEYGDHDRLVLDLAVAPTAFDVTSQGGCSGPGACHTSTTSSVDYGPTVGVGYEHVATSGFLFRPMLALNRSGPLFQLSIGAKLW